MTSGELKAWRMKRGLTQAEAARAAGISQEMWSMMESETKPIPPGFVPRGARPGSSPSRRGVYRK